VRVCVCVCVCVHAHVCVRETQREKDVSCGRAVSDVVHGQGFNNNLAGEINIEILFLEKHRLYGVSFR